MERLFWFHGYQKFLELHRQTIDKMNYAAFSTSEYKSVEYPPTSEILAELRRLENEVNTTMDELEQMLKWGTRYDGKW